jgi:hypothetical protein
MASRDTWLELNKYFWPEEFGAEAYENMEDAFLLKLYRFRVAIGAPMLIHEGYATSGHSTNSYHYKGRAVDFHFIHDPATVRRVVVTAVKCGLHGIGIYPHWNRPGFHLDDRHPDKFQMWKRNEKGVYIYVMGTVLPETI